MFELFLKTCWICNPAETYWANGIETYICARNQDAGLRDAKVEASLRRGLTALKRQYDRELKIARQRRK